MVTKTGRKLGTVQVEGHGEIDDVYSSLSRGVEDIVNRHAAGDRLTPTAVSLIRRDVARELVGAEPQLASLVVEQSRAARKVADPDGIDNVDAMADSMRVTRESLRKNRTNVVDQTTKLLLQSMVRKETTKQAAAGLRQYFSPWYATRRDATGKLVRESQVGKNPTWPGGSGFASQHVRGVMLWETTAAHARGMLNRADRENHYLKWNVSSAHMGHDVCDNHANRDVGFGAGVYPPEMFPSMPTHFRCRCFASTVILGPVEAIRRGAGKAELTEELLWRLRRGKEKGTVDAAYVDRTIKKLEKNQLTVAQMWDSFRKIEALDPELRRTAPVPPGIIVNIPAAVATQPKTKVAATEFEIPPLPSTSDYASTQDWFTSIGTRADLKDIKQWSEKVVKMNLGAERRSPEQIADGLRQALMNGVRRTLLDGARAPANFIVLPAFKGDNALATYQVMGDTITIQLDETTFGKQIFWDGDSWGRDMERSGWHSAGGREQTVIHEMGHKTHYDEWALATNNQSWPVREWDQIHRWTSFNEAEGKDIARKISQYGITNPVEFVAEVYGGSNANKTYSMKTYELYNELHGYVSPLVQAGWDRAKAGLTGPVPQADYAAIFKADYQGYGTTMDLGKYFEFSEKQTYDEFVNKVAAKVPGFGEQLKNAREEAVSPNADTQNLYFSDREWAVTRTITDGRDLAQAVDQVKNNRISGSFPVVVKFEGRNWVISGQERVAAYRIDERSQVEAVFINADDQIPTTTTVKKAKEPTGIAKYRFRFNKNLDARILTEDYFDAVNDETLEEVQKRLIKDARGITDPVRTAREDEFTEKLEWAQDDEDWTVVENIPVDSTHWTSSAFDIERGDVQKYLDDGLLTPAAPPLVLKLNGEYTVLTEHEYFAAARIRGDNTFPAVIIDFDNLFIHTRTIQEKTVEWIKTATDEQKQLLTDYQEGTFAFAVNDHLRSTPWDLIPEPMQEKIFKLSKAINQVKTDEAMTVFRGVPVQTMFDPTQKDLIRENWKLRVPGELYTDRAFVSTTLDYDFAEEWSGYGSAETPGIIFTIHVPAGTNGLYIDNETVGDTGYGGQKELLLDAGRQFRVVKVTDEGDDKPLQVEMEVVPINVSAGQEPPTLKSVAAPSREWSEPTFRFYEDIPRYQKDSDAWWKTLPPGAPAEILRYTSSGYRTINDDLRSGEGTLTDASTVIDRVPLLDEAVTAWGATKENLILRRAHPIDFEDILFDAAPGDTFTDHGFTSTTLDPYATHAVRIPINVTIEAPVGTRGMYLGGNTDADENEYEFVVDRGTTYMVLPGSTPDDMRLRIVAQRGDAVVVSETSRFASPRDELIDIISRGVDAGVFDPADSARMLNGFDETTMGGGNVIAYVDAMRKRLTAGPTLKSVSAPPRILRDVPDFDFFAEADAVQAEADAVRGMDKLTLDPKEWDAAQQYQDGDYMTANEVLRRQKTWISVPRGMIVNLDGAIAGGYRTLTETAVYRGNDFSESPERMTRYEALQPGDIYTDSGYASTTLQKEVAYDFMAPEGIIRDGGTNADAVLFKIALPPGTHGLFFGTDAFGTGGALEEHEFLLGRGSQYRVFKTYRDPQIEALVIEMELIPSETPPIPDLGGFSIESLKSVAAPRQLLEDPDTFFDEHPINMNDTRVLKAQAENDPDLMKAYEYALAHDNEAKRADEILTASQAWVDANKDSGTTRVATDSFIIVQDYQNGAFMGINPTLRRDGDESRLLEEELNNTLMLDEAFQDSLMRVPVDVAAYRGVDLDEAVEFLAQVEDMKPGDIFTDPGFISVSLDEEVAKEFANTETARDSGLFRIAIPAGTPGLFMGTENFGYGGALRESEMLLPRNQRFRIVENRIEETPQDFEESKRTHLITMEMIPTPLPNAATKKAEIRTQIVSAIDEAVALGLYTKDDVTRITEAFDHPQAGLATATQLLQDVNYVISTEKNRIARVELWKPERAAFEEWLKTSSTIAPDKHPEVMGELDQHIALSSGPGTFIDSIKKLFSTNPRKELESFVVNLPHKQLVLDQFDALPPEQQIDFVWGAKQAADLVGHGITYQGLGTKEEFLKSWYTPGAGTGFVKGLKTAFFPPPGPRDKVVDLMVGELSQTKEFILKKFDETPPEKQEAFLQGMNKLYGLGGDPPTDITIKNYISIGEAVIKKLNAASLKSVEAPERLLDPVHPRDWFNTLDRTTIEEELQLRSDIWAANNRPQTAIDPETDEIPPESADWYAIQGYQNGDGMVMNKVLRTQEPDEFLVDTPEMIALDRALRKTEIPVDIAVYRGFNGKGKQNYPQIKEINALKPGDIFKDPGFVSTSIDPKQAQRFAETGSEGELDKDNATTFQIAVPAGTRGLFVGTKNFGFTGALDEKEVILPRDSKFLVREVIRKPGDNFSKRTIVMELIPPGQSLKSQSALDAFNQQFETDFATKTNQFAAVKEAAKVAGPPVNPTIETAIAYARDAAGITFHDTERIMETAESLATIRGGDPALAAREILRPILAGIAQGIADDIPMPANISFAGPDLGDTLAEYIPTSDTILIHLHREWSRPQEQLESFQQGWHASPTREGVVLHELAHKAHLDILKNDWQDMLSWVSITEKQAAFFNNPKAVASTVSEYASQSPLEFVAEVYSGTQAGIGYSSDVWELYDALQGPSSSMIAEARSRTVTTPNEKDAIAATALTTPQSLKSLTKPEDGIILTMDTPASLKSVAVPLSELDALRAQSILDVHSFLDGDKKVIAKIENAKTVAAIDKILDDNGIGREIPESVVQEEPVFQDLSSPAKKVVLADHERWKESASSKQINSVVDYITDSGDIGWALRHPDDPTTSSSKLIPTITAAIQKSQLSEPIRVFRGVHRDDSLSEFTRQKVQTLEAGDVFSDEAFLSTSLDRDVAIEFADMDGNGGTLFEIDLPRGAEALYVSPLTKDTEEIQDFQYQEEVIVQRGSSFKVTRVRMEKGRRIVTMELVPDTTRDNLRAASDALAASVAQSVAA